MSKTHPDLLSVAQTARMLGLSESSIRRMVDGIAKHDHRLIGIPTPIGRLISRESAVAEKKRRDHLKGL